MKTIVTLVALVGIAIGCAGLGFGGKNWIEGASRERAMWGSVRRSTYQQQAAIEIEREQALAPAKIIRGQILIGVTTLSLTIIILALAISSSLTASIYLFRHFWYRGNRMALLAQTIPIDRKTLTFPLFIWDNAQLINANTERALALNDASPSNSHAIGAWSTMSTEAVRESGSEKGYRLLP